MLLLFPNPETLRLALIAGAVPEAVGLGTVTAGFDAQGQVWVEPPAALPQAAQAELRRLGVQVRRSAGVPLDEEFCCWPQLLPLRRETVAPAPTDRTPVLFDVAEAEFFDLVNEVLRLGNDRQSFRRLEDDTDSRMLLRVVGPPYYSLLRALDHDGGESAPRAYVERNPRVWVALGYTHPLVEQLQPPPGKLLLMQPPRTWTFLDEAKFRDIYEVLEFALPSAAVRWRATDLGHRLRVPLRLTRAGSMDAPELWVLRDQGVDQLDALVGGADNHLLARLAFAVGTKDGQTTVVLRVRPSRLPPPVLVLDGIGFRSYLKLPNLFLPCGARLYPPLRRDAVSKLLAADPALVTWLYPQPDGTFTPESLPDEAFRPLEHWVDYVLDRDHQALEAWAQAARFDFESFVCKDDQPQPAKRLPERAPPRPKKGQDEAVGPAAEPIPDAEAEAPDQPLRKKREDTFNEPELPEKPNELQERLRDLEKCFLKLTSPLDGPDRRPLWREMAQLNTALGRAGDATVCWVNALWEGEASWSGSWLRAERTGAAQPELTGGDLDRLLGQADPDRADMQALAAYLAWAHDADQPLPELGQRLGQVQHFLEQHEGLLPVRAVWLAWLGLVRLSGGDVLGLARARDRLLELLYRSGLSGELDQPGFLRFSGAGSGDRFRIVRDHMVRLRSTVRNWLASCPSIEQKDRTREYADLLLAFGLARLGEMAECQKVLEAVGTALEGRDEVHTWLWQAYAYRIRQALEGKPHAGRLPAELLGDLERWQQLPREPKDAHDYYKLQCYKIDRLREHSRILEPHEKVSPYRRWHGHFEDELSRELATLGDLNDRAKLAEQLTRLLQGKRKWARVAAPQARILGTALELAPRLGEEFARDLLGRVGPALDGLAEPLDQALLLEKGLFLAAHFDQTEQVQAFVARFHRLLEAQEADTIHTLEPLLQQCFHGLRKLGMREEIGRLLERMAGLVLQGADPGVPEEDKGAKGGKGAKAGLARLLQRVTGLVRKGGKTKEASAVAAVSRSGPAVPRTLKFLLQVAGGWFYFGQDDRAWPILDAVREVLFHGDLIPVEQKDLACAYVRALGQAPIERVLPRLEELFRKIERIQDTFTTNSHYALSRLDLVEAVVLALVGEDFRLSQAGRRWLDEDEFLVRRRIHRDVRAAMSRAGL